MRFLAALVFTALIRSSLTSRHPDFSIFWKTGSRLIHGEWIYNVAADGSQCFKYPPWIAPIFAPLALIPEEWAGVAWRMIQVASLAWLYLKISQPLSSQGKRAVTLLLVGWMGIWNYNLLTGQISLLLAAVTFWATLPSAPSPGRLSFGVLALTTKVFHLLAAGGWGKKLLRLRFLATLALLALLLSVPAWLGEPRGSWSELIRGFFAAASTGGGNLFGAYNGLPALFLRASGLPLDRMDLQILASIPAAILAGITLIYAGLRLPGDRERVALGLALSVSITPLAFNYSLALMFPWFAWSLGRTFSEPSTRWQKTGMVAAALWVALPLPYRSLATYLTAAMLSAPEAGQRKPE